MFELSATLWKLPRRPGARGHSSLDLGIDRLRRDPICIMYLIHYADEFEHRPTASEVERIGRELVSTKLSLDEIRRDHRGVRREEADSRNQPPGYAAAREPAADCARRILGCE
jgi:hypothetical protein